MKQTDDFFERTLRSIDFTINAERKIRRITSTEAFQDMPPEDTLRFLLEELDQIPFSDHLKRYIYQQADMTGDFRSVKDETWVKIIDASFEESMAPHSFAPTTTRWNATIKSWLHADRVRRDTVFLLAFGLRMTAEEVSEMLTKALNEEDFNPDDPREVIFHYCFAHDLPYSYAFSKMKEAEAMKEDVLSQKRATESFPDSEIELTERLQQLKIKEQHTVSQERYNRFMELYDRCRKMIAGIYNQDEMEKPEKSRRQWNDADITPSDLEQMLCSGVPTTGSGNLIKADYSRLNKRFDTFRPSRQHLEGVIRRQLQVDRYDLITLSFFLYSGEACLDDYERFRRFNAETNEILHSCRMRSLYPVHPYEAFIMICMMSPCPLAHYGDVIEISYEE